VSSHAVRTWGFTHNGAQDELRRKKGISESRPTKLANWQMIPVKNDGIL
jgi:hypothetical protein